MENDLRLASHTPSIRAMASQIGSAGIVPADLEFSVEQRDRLADLFSSRMVVRPEYTQMRFIGLPDQGRELVRVNKTPEGIIRARDAALQRKGNEPYFLEVITHMASQEHFSETDLEHAITFSDVTYNRENGRIVIPKVATIRSIFASLHDGARTFRPSGPERRLREPSVPKPLKTSFKITVFSSSTLLATIWNTKREEQSQIWNSTTTIVWSLRQR